MSDAAPAKAEERETLPATPEDMEGIGLEDFETSDMVMPRINIVHDEAMFQDNLSGEKHDSIRAVILGLVKQRILWDDEVVDGDTPLCKSYNFHQGHPDPTRFPFKDASFDKGTIEGEDDPTLPCSACQLKEWGSHPKRETPWCSEQHTFPLLMEVSEDQFAPALLTVQRSGIKPSKSYLTSFARSKTPLYTVVTNLTLNAQKRGSVNYAVPAFSRGEPTDSDDWGFYAQQYRQIREFITTPPVRDDDDDAGSGAPSAPSSGDAPAASEPDDDLPF